MKQFRVNKITTIFRGKHANRLKSEHGNIASLFCLEVFDYGWLLTWQMARHPYASCQAGHKGWTVTLEELLTMFLAQI